MPIITIFDGSYCHGNDVAESVTSRLGYERIDKSLLETVSKKYDIPKANLIKSLKGQATFINKLTHDREKNIARVKAILAEAIQKDKQILYGYEGHLIPRTISHILRVCLIGNFDYRVEQAAHSKSLSRKDSEKLIHRDDKERLEWTSFLYEKPPYDASLYDIVIPMHSTSVNDAVETICQYAQSENVRPTERSVKVTESFILGASVELALIEAGHGVSVYSEEGNVIITLNKEVMRQKQYEDELRKIASEIDGVKNVEIKLSPRFQTASLNPWANLEVPPRILLVDDEKEFVHTLSERLQTRSFKSSIVYDGEQAIEYLKSEQPDVMVLDLMMPGINGMEVLRQVKSDHPDVEVIILTGHGSKTEEEQAEDLGAFAYLNKPVNIDLLARVMKEAYLKINRNRDSKEAAD
ncbi:MAG: response regulator [Candidatus Zixiibacteriota bacterium]